MRVLHVIDKSFLGGGQTVVRNQIAGALEAGLEPALACRDGGPLVDAVRALGVPVHPIPFDKRFRPGPARSIADLVRGWKADVVHGHGLVATTYAVLAARLEALRIPLVYQQHGFHEHNYRFYSIGLRRASERAVCRRVARVVTDSRVDRDEVVARGWVPAARVETIYCGVRPVQPQPEATENVRRELGLDPARPVIGIVARLHPQKGVDTFLEAAALVRREAPGCQVVVVGDGELAGELRALGTRLGLDGVLRWAGGRPFGPVLPLLRIGVLTSRWEGLPQILLDYMAAGCPIVTTAVPGCLEAVGDAAEVVPVEAPRETAQAILRLLRSPELAASCVRRARRRFLDHFTVDVMTRRLAGLYEELTA